MGAICVADPILRNCQIQTPLTSLHCRFEAIRGRVVKEKDCGGKTEASAVWSHPHTANVTLDWLKRSFQDRIISRRTGIEWAIRTRRTLTPPNFVDGVT